MLSTEYKLKFQDFSGHCQPDGPAPDTSVTDGPVPGLGRAKTWYSDLLEARRKAVTYKVSVARPRLADRSQRSQR